MNAKRIAIAVILALAASLGSAAVLRRDGWNAEQLTVLRSLSLPELEPQ